VIVLDASVAVELLLVTPDAAAVEARIARDPSLHAPGLLDVEVAQTIRRYCAAGQVRAARGAQAIADLIDFPVRRYPHGPLLERIWQLRGRLTAYDAAYIALAATLGACLLTRDRRLARGAGRAAEVEVL